MDAIDAAGVARATAVFRAHFGGADPTFAAAAPGRINIVGEHTDYNDGFVFPLALEKNTYIVGAPQPAGATPLCEVVAAAFPGIVARFPPADGKGSFASADADRADAGAAKLLLPDKPEPAAATDANPPTATPAAAAAAALATVTVHPEVTEGAVAQDAQANAPGDGGGQGEKNKKVTGDKTDGADGEDDDQQLPGWARYVRGMVAMYARDGHQVPAFRAAVVSDVPIGSGLSSSAALEMATAVLLEQLIPIDTPDTAHRARLGQTCEHEFAGVPCGIMDQLVSSKGKPGAALLIDCRSLDCTPVPLSDPDVVFVVANSNVSHQLSGSEYPQRRAQCAEAAHALAAAFPAAKITHLRDATPDQLDSIRDTLAPETEKRARHVILEDRRTLETREAFERGDYATAGQRMLASHESLRDLFEVSTPEIDALVRIAMTVPGVFGSRITGGGFGGCTVSLVRRDAVETFMAAVDKHYPEHSGGKTATMFATAAGPGARALSHLL